MGHKTVITKLLQSVTDVYYKMPQVLQSVTGCYYKVRLVLQSVTSYYYKVRQVLQSAIVITKWDVTKDRIWTPRKSFNKSQKQESYNFWLNKENSIESVGHSFSHDTVKWSTKEYLKLYNDRDWSSVSLRDWRLFFR